MNFLLSASPFWDRLFYFLPVRDQVNLMLVCRQLRSIGNLSRHIQHRFTLVKYQIIMKYRGEEMQKDYFKGQTPADYWAKEGRLDRLLPEERTLERCWIGVDNYGAGLIDVPLNYRTKELCLFALTKNAENISHVPWDLRDEEMYLKALNSCYFGDWRDIWHQIPPIHQTPKIAEVMVKRWPYTIRYIAPHLITPELLLLSAQNCKYVELVVY